MNNIQLIILGIYTLAYIVVFFIQKASIDSLKENVNNQNGVINSMKSFMDIFDLNKIKEYVKVNEESAMLKASNFLADDEKVKGMALEFTKEHADLIKNLQMEKLGAQYSEMSEVIAEFLKIIKPEDRERFITEKLESCKHIFIPILDKIDDNDS
ncbi:hypothetical protein [Flavobacterium psychrophilum]|uniref:hypothetical protein n=1 Tax=Flavobacterium psychrophilum TaxID=96345 RepID=UPI000F51273E|nr:hypothetical protein [Flavobacterium psychrophilum]